MCHPEGGSITVRWSWLNRLSSCAVSCCTADSSSTAEPTEKVAIAAHPFDQRADARLDIDHGRPTEQRLRPADIGYVDALVARPPVCARHPQRRAQLMVEQRCEFEQGQGMRRPATDVESQSTRVRAPLDHRFVDTNEVIDVQQVAHLLAVAIECDRMAKHGGDGEPRDPALVFDAE